MVIVRLIQYKGEIEERCRKLTAEATEMENNKKMEKLKDKLLCKFADVFKKELTPQDRVHMPPVKLETTSVSSSIRPLNCMTPIETPLHLRKAANRELQKILKAGMIERCHHPTEWCSRGFFVPKPGSIPEDLKARMESDFNRILLRVKF